MQSHSSKSNDVDNSEFEESSYHDILMWSQSQGNRFTFRRDFVIFDLLTKLEAVFIQDLINRATMKKIIRKEIEGKTYFLCTVEFLIRSLRWDRNHQIRLIKKLSEEDRDYLRVKKLGNPPSRWMWINIVKLEKDLQNAMKSSSTSFSVDETTSNDVDETTSNDVTKNVTTEVVTKQKKKKENVTHSVRDRHTPSKSGFLPQETTNEKTDSLSKIDEEFAKQLYKALGDKNKLMRRNSSIVKWSKEFRLLREDIEVDRIRKVLNWYCKNIGVDRVRQVYSAKAFREEFLKLENNMDVQLKIKEEQKQTEQRNW